MAHEWPSYPPPCSAFTPYGLMKSDPYIMLIKTSPSFTCKNCSAPPCRCPSTLEIIKRKERERKEKAIATKK